MVSQGATTITTRFIAATSMTTSDQTFTFDLTAPELSSITDVTTTPLTATGTWDADGTTDGVEVNAMSITLTESGTVAVWFNSFFIIMGG